ncbi:MAG: family 20 glycosylhydrolase [Candidatus Krumholzibacteriota bacterium]
MTSPDVLLPLIPGPTSWRPSGGTFLWADLQRIVVRDDGIGLTDQAERAAIRLKTALGLDLPVQVAGPGDAPGGSLLLRRIPGAGPEQYEMKITGEGIEISATHPQGFFHGVSSLIQLALNGPPSSPATTLPQGTIRDQPRFGWRGMLLDCGRHFMPVESIKELLDKLALHKFNVLHWHLTEDQGWRLEIPGYPRLTEIGAWRTETDGSVSGGFYTTEDVRDIVAYAAERFITVVPEIEMPGHSQAALAAYPELSCTGGPFEVQTQWGVHKDILCAGREETFTFLEDVLVRVMEMFPGRYIHIGGDEAPRDRWKKCARCQARIRDENLSGEDDLQSWFIGRIGTFLSGHGRRLIGWDEILDGGLPGDPNHFTVQAWRGLDKAAAAARAGHDVIVSPTSHAYFDYDPGVLDLQQVFEFRPVPAGLDPAAGERILGGQMNLWTEYIPPERVDTMLFPRLTAMAEALWTGADNRDFPAFLDRLDRHGPVLDLGDVRPGPAARPVFLDGGYDPALGHHGLETNLDSRIADAFAGRHLAVRYLILESPFPPSFRPGRLPEDQGLPAVERTDDVSPEILEIHPADRTDSSRLVQTRLFIDDRPYGAPALLEISDHAALGAEIVFAHAPGERYPGGGPRGLVNGLHGSRFYQDGLWTGFEGHDLDATMDLGRVRDLGEVSIRFLQDANSWIFLPREVVFLVSRDGKSWRRAGSVTHRVSEKRQEKLIHEFALDLSREAVQFLRIQGVSPRVCPDWHPGSGQPCWVFADEIVCR